MDAINEDSIFGAKSNLLSINEWSAQGTCICNGHASMCSPVEGESMYPEKVSEYAWSYYGLLVLKSL